MEKPQIRENRKSVKIEKDLIKAFKKWVNEQPTKIDAAIELSISRQSLDRVLQFGLCSGETYNKIVNVLNVTA